MNLFKRRNPLAIPHTTKKKVGCSYCKYNRACRLPIPRSVVAIVPNEKFIVYKQLKTLKGCTIISATPCKTPDVDNVYKHCNVCIEEYLQANLIETVVLIGASAVRSYFGQKYKGILSIDHIAGHTFRDPFSNRKICALADISIEAITQDYNKYSYQQLERTVFVNNLQTINRPLPKKITIGQLNKICKYISVEEAIEYMKQILNNVYDKFVAFDFETTGLKPYREGHRILTCGLCTNMKSSVAFVVNSKTIPYLRKIIASYTIPKVAANIGFEYTWSKEYLKCPVNNLIYDVCLSAHLLNQKRGQAGVKLNALLYYGILDYGVGVDKYIKPVAEESSRYGANGFNTLHKAHESTVCVYNAVDAFVEYKLAYDMMRRYENSPDN